MSQSIFHNPFVSQNPELTNSSVGNGTLTIDRLTHHTINQDYTAICTATSPFTVFNIVGSLDGIVGVAVVGQQFFDEDLKLFLTIQQGPILFQVGDTFEFSLSQGTDLNQQNIDAYDELPQKNFGEGIPGENKGNHNIRFSKDQTFASKIIQDLRFKSKIAGPQGNLITIEYLEGSELKSASLIQQALTFTANNPGLEGNQISVTYENAPDGEFASVIIQDIEYVAENIGTVGNLISIEYVGGGTAGSEVVTVAGNKITVKIEDGVSTSMMIEEAVSSHPVASLLVNPSTISEDGDIVQNIQANTFLVGGLDDTPNYVSLVDNKDITVGFKNSITTASEIRDLLYSDPNILMLVTVLITGGPDSTQTSPVAKKYLTGGSISVGEPGDEQVEVINREIKVYFVNNASTANQIKSALESNIDVMNLVDVFIAPDGDGNNTQLSPYSKVALSGGRNEGTFSFNTDELTDENGFFEGNSAIAVKTIINQGNEYTSGETLKNGKVTLDDNLSTNLSGPKVDNVQKTINNSIRNFGAIIFCEEHAKVHWSGSSLTFSKDIVLLFPNGVRNKISAIHSPIVILENQHLYIEVDHLNGVVCNPMVASIIPHKDNAIRIATKIEDDLIWFDNTFQKEGKDIVIGEGGGAGGAAGGGVGIGLFYADSRSFNAEDWLFDNGDQFGVLEGAEVVYQTSLLWQLDAIIPTHKLRCPKIILGNTVKNARDIPFLISFASKFPNTLAGNFDLIIEFYDSNNDIVGSFINIVDGSILENGDIISVPLYVKTIPPTSTYMRVGFDILAFVPGMIVFDCFSVAMGIPLAKRIRRLNQLASEGPFEVRGTDEILVIKAQPADTDVYSLVPPQHSRNQFTIKYIPNGNNVSGVEFGPEVEVENRTMYAHESRTYYYDDIDNIWRAF